METSHPIIVEVNDPNEITSLFDSISYSKVNLKKINLVRIRLLPHSAYLIKGASIIRMMSAFLTEKTFRAGVSVNNLFIFIEI